MGFLQLKHTDEGDLVVDNSDYPQATKSAYGFDIEDVEWQLTVRWSPGQNGRVVFAVILTEIDFGMVMEQHECDMADFNFMLKTFIGEVTKHWIEPMEVNFV